jgi:hypothetical protein
MSNKKFYLLIETDQYTGNFNRELCSYVFGAYYDAQDWVDDLRRLFYTEVGEDHALTEMLLNFYDEHGPTVCEIHKQDNLKVFFESDPTPFMKLILERLKKFPAVLAKAGEFCPKNVKIKRVTLFQEIAKEEVVWVEKL